MTNPDQNEATTGPSTADELAQLKEQAKALGINFHPNIGLDNLKERVAAQSKPPAKVVFTEIEPVKNKLTAQQEKVRTIKEATKLIRIRVTCMNPNKKDWEGEIFTVSNSIVPTQKKYVPFNAEDGWHVPQIIVNVIQERKCQIFKTIKGPRGNKIRKGSLVPEFNVEILDALTKEELTELKEQQILAHNID